MQKESLLFFSFPSEKDSRLVSLGLSKKFGEARGPQLRRSCPFHLFSQKSRYLFGVSLDLHYLCTDKSQKYNPLTPKTECLWAKIENKTYTLKRPL